MEKDFKRLITIEELKGIQLDILSYFDNFCRSNNIKYSLACGTLLGAVRHKGYIPWDDDIDVYMLREEYIKFVFSFRQANNDPYRLSIFNDTKDIDRVYANLYDSRTVLVEGTSRLFDLGVFIDIFPLDDVPDNKKDWNTFKRKLFIISWLKIFKVLKWSKKRDLHKNIFLYIVKIIIYPLSLYQILTYMNTFIQKNNGKGYNHVYQASYGIENEEALDKQMFYDLIDYEFEGHLFKGVHNADEYLKKLYGDYMQFPPVEKQVSHHVFKAWWK